MKRLLLSLAAVAGLTGLLQAQAPSGFSYQAALRNSSGQALANQNVSLRFTIRDASTSGSILYQETQSKTTNAQGLVSCTVGTGTVGLGSYPSAAQLSSGLKFLQVEIDPVGGASYAEVSNTQIVSVPYANYANAAGTATSAVSATTATSATSATTAGTANALNPSATVGISQLTAGGASAGQVLKWNGSAWVPSADDNTVLTAGTGVTISSGVINTPWTISGNNIYNNNSGNVGIGTASPLSRFHLKGNGEMGRLEFASSSTNGDWLGMYHKSTYIGYLGNYNDTHGLDFGTSGVGTKVHLVTGATPRLTVSGSQVGIGTTTPTTMSKLHVNGFGTYSNTGPYYQAIIVADGASPSASSSGVYGTAGWRGVFGHNLGNWNGYQAIGVYGLQEGRKYTIGYGVLGEIKGNAPQAYGVYGQSDSGSTTSVGVFGLSNSRVSGLSAGVYGKGSQVGVYANSAGVGRNWAYGFVTLAPAMIAQQRTVVSGRQAGLLVHSSMNGSSGHSGILVACDSSTSGNFAIEAYVRNSNSTTATNYAIYTNVSGGSTSSYAGYFGGAIYANSANSSIKAFKIDHPLDPENKYLYHSSVESPDMMNIYNGNVVTDANGDATVTLPNYFSALNIDFKYQLTCIGQFAQAIVAEEISEGTFKIKTDKPNVKVSWQVTGVRNDAVAQKYRLQPEVEKPQSEKGFYLIPEAYGYGPERNAAWYNSSQNTEMKYPVKAEVPQVKPARNENNQR